MANVTVVVGGQFGSEGKGAICGFLGRSMGEEDVAIRVAGPNAGHTAYDPQGREWKLRAVPVAAVTSTNCQLHIAAGSEIDLDVLGDEIDRLDEAGHRVSERLSIHPSATILTDRHKRLEGAAGLVGRIGSTGKGIGAARADRIMREAAVYGDLAQGPYLAEEGPFDLDGVGHAVIEGTQGYGLGLHTPFYPKTTSSDCRAIDFLAMAGISPWDSAARDLDVIVVARVYPIRVAGNSGPLVEETTWDALGLPEERTTVTNKVRRVGAWDQQLVLDAIKANGGGDYNPNVVLALTMLDHRFPSQAGRTDLDDEPLKWVNDLEAELRTFIEYVGTGPQSVAGL